MTLAPTTPGAPLLLHHLDAGTLARWEWAARAERPALSEVLDWSEVPAWVLEVCRMISAFVPLARWEDTLRRLANVAHRRAVLTPETWEAIRVASRPEGPEGSSEEGAWCYAAAHLRLAEEAAAWGRMATALLDRIEAALPASPGWPDGHLTTYSKRGVFGHDE